MEFIVLENIKKENNIVKYYFSCPVKFKKYLKIDECKMVIEYPVDCNINTVPEGILIVPFVGNILIASSLLNIGIKVPVLDQSFYESLPLIKQSFKSLYPYLNMNFNVESTKLEDCRYNLSSTKSLFFTGGVDATSALISLHKKEPILVNIVGGDVNTNDVETHNQLDLYLQHIHRSFNLEYAFIKANCREMYDEFKITKFLATKILPWKNHGWWASIAHILSMTTLLAPWAYDKKIGEHYIGSSYAVSSNVFDSNNDAILEAIKFGSCNLIGVDNDLSRIDKLKNIITFSKEHSFPVELKVCWYRHAGENCSHCEKCYRTIMEIIVNKGDPNNFGFKVDKNTYLEIENFLKTNYVNSDFWKQILIGFKKEENYWRSIPELSWILDLRINTLALYIKKIFSTINRFMKK